MNTLEIAQLPWYKVPFQFMPWWANLIIIIYLCYAVFYRVWKIYQETMDEGFFRGLFDVYLGEAKPIFNYESHAEARDAGVDRKIIGYQQKYLRLYHILWMIVDLPCIAVGACIPFIRRVFTVKIAPLTRPSKEDLD